MREPATEGAVYNKPHKFKGTGKAGKPLKESHSGRCGWCGRAKHDRKNCPANNAVCHTCKKRGHFSEVCRNRSQPKANKVQSVDVAKSSDSENFLGAIGTTAKKSGSSKNWSVDMQVEGIPIKFRIDTGADVTVIPAEWIPLELKSKMQPASRVLLGPNKQELETEGEAKMAIKYQKQTLVCTVCFVKGLSQALLGLEEIQKFCLLKRINHLNSESEFQSLFTGLGELTEPYTIRLKTDAIPHAISTPRRVPIPLMKPLKELLDRMVADGIAVFIDDPTDWCSPIVIVLKPDGTIRLCVDYTALNEAILREYHPIPSVEYTLAKLSGAKLFSKLDCNSGFWQVPLSEESALLTTFITPYGRFYFKRLPFGISSAPEHFQKRIEKVLSGLPGIVSVYDDILVWGSTKDEHDDRLRAVLSRLKAANLTLNSEKCKFSVTEVTEKNFWGTW